MDDNKEPLDDIANYDPWIEGGGVHGFIGKPVASYNLVFDDEEQLKRFYSFIRRLKKIYPSVRTIGGRVNAYLEANEVKNEGEKTTQKKK